MALQQLSGGRGDTGILAAPQASFGGQPGADDGRLLTQPLMPPRTRNVPNVYGYPEGLPPEIRGVMNATQPFSREMQGRMNMVDNMNNAYQVQDLLAERLRNGMGQTAPSYGDMGTGEDGMGGDTTSSSSPSTRPKAKASGAGASSGSEKAGSKDGSESAGGKGGADNALSMLRKQRSGGMWNTLGTGVSLVQRSLAPEKGGLKSRTEYDRLLRGSDNFKKLDGDDQQRVRQAFSQWMDEQTLFKGKA